jgi:two-component system response regulator NreC
MNILLIEDQVLIRELLAMACQRVFPKARVQSAANRASGLRLCRTLVPDLIFLDMVLPDGEGIDLVPELRAAAPKTKIIGISAHTDEFTLHRISQAMLDGFVDKNEQTLDLLREAAASVMAGTPFFSPSAKQVWAGLKANPLAFFKVLSGREIELLQLFGEGLDNEAIAARLGLSVSTVRNHRQNIMDKLGLRSTPQLMRYALERGFTRGKT